MINKSFVRFNKKKKRTLFLANKRVRPVIIIIIYQLSLARADVEGSCCSTPKTVSF